MYVIGSGCIDIKDKECLLSCPVDCIYEGERMLYIDPSECIDCGSCMPVCPTGAIFEDFDMPEKEKVFIGINESFFQDNPDRLDPAYVKEYKV